MGARGVRIVEGGERKDPLVAVNRPRFGWMFVGFSYAASIRLCAIRSSGVRICFRDCPTNKTQPSGKGPKPGQNTGYVQTRKNNKNTRFNNIKSRIVSITKTVKPTREPTQRSTIVDFFPPLAPNNTRLAKDIKIAKMMKNFNVLDEKISVSKNHGPTKFKQIEIGEQKYRASVLLSKLGRLSK